ncbi:hypothetical protein CO2235_MP80184 [Cupriavidus oxalaticus]|uniref:Uncharacterized protein n=1 Tax=Cupriavidus oxalaticus TaxID=96344 RepID=A0A375FT20_9BURK|nr:hypothetical protein CO2235_U840010 [Cupriavidus oxalaticus]SPC24304.1 hypothetical protein CO2235_MP80184 [Cupriavidus oxalaticus]
MQSYEDMPSHWSEKDSLQALATA